MGGSWGVTLALAYAESHSDSVAGLILRGVCLLRPHEIDWFYKQVFHRERKKCLRHFQGGFHRGITLMYKRGCFHKLAMGPLLISCLPALPLSPTSDNFSCIFRF